MTTISIGLFVLLIVYGLVRLAEQKGRARKEADVAQEGSDAIQRKQAIANRTDARSFLARLRARANRPHRPS